MVMFPERAADPSWLLMIAENILNQKSFNSSLCSFCISMYRPSTFLSTEESQLSPLLGIFLTYPMIHTRWQKRRQSYDVWLWRSPCESPSVKSLVAFQLAAHWEVIQSTFHRVGVGGFVANHMSYLLHLYTLSFTAMACCSLGKNPSFARSLNQALLCPIVKTSSAAATIASICEDLGALHNALQKSSTVQLMHNCKKMLGQLGNPTGTVPGKPANCKVQTLVFCKAGPLGMHHTFSDNTGHLLAWRNPTVSKVTSWWVTTIQEASVIWIWKLQRRPVFDQMMSNACWSSSEVSLSPFFLHDSRREPFFILGSPHWRVEKFKIPCNCSEWMQFAFIVVVYGILSRFDVMETSFVSPASQSWMRIKLTFES